jgi:hypothetical protein
MAPYSCENFRKCLRSEESFKKDLATFLKNVRQLQRKDEKEKKWDLMLLLYQTIHQVHPRWKIKE